jgi:hypothetical protein
MAATLIVEEPEAVEVVEVGGAVEGLVAPNREMVT